MAARGTSGRNSLTVTVTVLAVTALAHCPQCGYGRMVKKGLVVVNYFIYHTAYMTYMPHCVSYASGINSTISSHPIFDGYFCYIQSYESPKLQWVMMSHMTHMSLGEPTSQAGYICWICGYFGLLLISLSHESQTSQWVMVNCMIHMCHLES